MLSLKFLVGALSQFHLHYKVWYELKQCTVKDRIGTFMKQNDFIRLASSQEK